MNRNEFISLLARLVDDGEINASEAEKMLASFDNGEYGDIDPSASPADLIPRDESFIDEAAAVALLLLILGRREADSLTTAQRIQAIDDTQDSYKASVANLAKERQNGLVLADWQTSVRDELAKMAGVMLMIGAGVSALSQQHRAFLLPYMRSESAYLSRFGDQIVYRTLLQSPPTLLYEGARAGYYGAQARSEAFRTMEQIQPEGDQTGWVSKYEAVDDSGTCVPCGSAEGFYLPNDGPYPGDVCQGGGFCRCKRFLVFNMAEWERLQ